MRKTYRYVNLCVLELGPYRRNDTVKSRLEERSYLFPTNMAKEEFSGGWRSRVRRFDAHTVKMG